MCRPAASECDLPEYCTGVNAECPLNTYKKNGSPCSDSRGYCYNGFCPTLDQQCKAIWDWGGIWLAYSFAACGRHRELMEVSIFYAIRKSGE